MDRSSSTSLLIVVVTLLTVLLGPATYLVAQNRETTVVARLNHQAITQADVDESVASQVYQLQQQIFAVRKTALEALISKRLLEDEAKRRNISVGQLRSTLLGGSISVEPAKVEELYMNNRQAFGLMDPDEAKEKLRMDLEGQAKLKKYRQEIAGLRQKANVELLLEEPRIIFVPTYRASHAKGADGAPIVITEFSDFQCPYCREVQGTLSRVVEKYPAEVRLQFKHLPLPNHALALNAARAAYCGGQQEMFWQFHDGLFNASLPSAAAIQEIARSLRLNLTDFNACLTSHDSLLAITGDLQEAQKLGISSTPSFLINGKVLSGVLTVEEFENAIRGELKRLSLRSNLSN